ncbi:MAG: ATP-binding protein [Archangium sp.]|nr:ATP-binding protein [Archangium sp.]
MLFAVALTPVLVIGLTSYRATREELTRVVQSAQEDSAAHLAQLAESAVLHSVETLALTTHSLPLESFSNGELSEVLHIPLRQVAGLTAVAVIDEDGHAIVPPVFEPELGREAPTLAEMAAHVPLAEAFARGAAIGPPYRTGTGAPRVVIAVSQGQRVIAAELSLSDVVTRLAALEAHGRRAVLVDSTGAPLAGALTLTASELALVRRRALSSASVEGDDDEPRLASFAPTATLGWGVLVLCPSSLALGAANRVRDFTVFFAVLSLLLAGPLSVWLARGFSRPIAELSVAARALSEGRYDVELPSMSRGDEVGAFAATFRHMASEIRRRGEEIGSWNRQLQQRVEERTTELRAAQQQVLRSQRLAALGSMGAGIAHELNNPLTGVLGLVSLVTMNLPEGSEDAESLQLALEQARRMGKIIERLQGLTESERQGAGEALSIERPVTEALGAAKDQLASLNIAVSTRFEPSVPDVQGDPEQLRELVRQLVDNAANAMPGGGRLEVCLSAVEGPAVKLAITDTGRGIAAEHRERIFDPFFTTKDHGASGGVGLGLSTCHRIVEQHFGKITVESVVGQGSTFVVMFPASSQKAHLV